MSDWLGSYPYFRLNFEQQQKRAKDLLRAARAGEPDALQRLARTAALKAGIATVRLANAQLAIARELRFTDWAALKKHVARMESERAGMDTGAIVDGKMRTLHVRCGSDLKLPLREAGFHGDFYEHNYPYLIGPVREGTGALEERAQYLCCSHADAHDPPLEYEGVLGFLRMQEQMLLDSAGYERVVIWSEGDCYDQLVLVRLLGHYARHSCPRRIELINAGDFPGGLRFIGLGQLPPEALRLLWNTRRARAGRSQLDLGLAAWMALANPDPRDLAAILRTGTPALPLLGPALHRHLRELPSAKTGLSCTEEMALGLLAQRPHSLMRMFGRLTYEIDPLPGQGDMQMRDRVLDMERANERLFTRVPGLDREGRARPPWTDILAITDLGRRVLAGEVDFRSLEPAPRWVGGVHVTAGGHCWRWDEERRDVALRAPLDPYPA